MSRGRVGCLCCQRRWFSSSIVSVLILVLLESTYVSTAIDTPEYILPCNRTDPNINSCIKNSFNHLRPYLQKGIAEIDLPAIEPLLIPKLAMENGNGAVRVRAVFSNMNIHGASNYTVAAVKSDVAAYRIDMGLTIPRIEASGSYEVTGNVLLFPVRSRGEFYAVFYDVAALAKIHGKEVVNNGTNYMKVDKLLVDFSLGKSRFRIRDHLNGGNVLGEAMNQFLNQNAQEIIQEMKPAATQSIARHFKSFLNNAFLKVPIALWLRD
ncbi:protein takeout [Anabrus simplex]|uniref:protein takeout n=1 Tax=Anabrus simplex TaxID=316456 RepID=UPI0034DD02F2